VLTLSEVVQATGGALRGAPAGDLALTRAVVDSRAPLDGALFVALHGQRRDGHDFVAHALAGGAAAALVDHVPPDWREPGGRPLVLVPSTQRALEAMARWLLARHPRLDVVGVTGSLGKTTTKEVVASVLASRYAVLKSEGNQNSEVGLPLSVLNGLRAEHRVAVLEMGMYAPGDVRFLARLARPRIGVVTAVLPVHLERLGTIERIRRAKQELVEELPAERGVAVLNGDDPRVSAMADATPARVVRYGVGAQADVRAERIASRGLEGVDFDLVAGGARRRVHLPLLGAHNVHAALAAAAVGLELGLGPDDVAEAVGALEPALRLRVLGGPNGSRILDDSYNASPESVLAALELLRELPGRRKIAVLGDMLELGSESEPGHRRVGQRAALVLDLLITYGPRARATADEARRSGLRPEQVVEAEDPDAIADWLRRRLRAGDDVLVKGSLAMGMSRVVAALRAGVETPAW
jgi:UDP-N-acetylmuramoyl-tripeptide--D-alanyl-D-alanine ligase